MATEGIQGKKPEGIIQRIMKAYIKWKYWAAGFDGIETQYIATSDVVSRNKVFKENIELTTDVFLLNWNY